MRKICGIEDIGEENDNEGKKLKKWGSEKEEE